MKNNRLFRTYIDIKSLVLSCNNILGIFRFMQKNCKTNFVVELFLKLQKNKYFAIFHIYLGFLFLQSIIKTTNTLVFALFHF